MNSQVLIDRELLQELADFCSDSRSYNEAIRVLATPAPIPDADHSEDVRTMVVPDIARFEKHAMKAKDCLSECDVVLLSSIRRLLASPAPSAVVMPAVPDGYKLVPIEPTAAQCFTAAFNLCNEFGDEFVRDNKQFALAAYRSLVAAGPSAKGGE